jgi:hypothetical protein
VLRDERFQLADELTLPAEVEIGVDPVLEERPANLLETPDLSLCPRFVAEIGQRRPAPERERVA